MEWFVHVTFGKNETGLILVASVLIIDDQDLVRLGLVLVLRQVFPGLKVLEAPSAGSALTRVSPSEPIQIVLLDWFVPGEELSLSVRRIKTQWPSVRLVVISGIDSPVSLAQMRAIGADGFISKGATPSGFQSGLNAVLQGEGCLLSPTNGAVDVSAGLGAAPDDKALSLRQTALTLSPRRKEVLNLLLRGLSYREIASELKIAEDTVKQHAQAIYAIFGVSGRNQLQALWTNGSA